MIEESRNKTQVKFQCRRPQLSRAMRNNAIRSRIYNQRFLLRRRAIAYGQLNISITFFIEKYIFKKPLYKKILNTDKFYSFYKKISWNLVALPKIFKFYCYSKNNILYFNFMLILKTYSFHKLYSMLNCFNNTLLAITFIYLYHCSKFLFKWLKWYFKNSIRYLLYIKINTSRIKYWY